MTLDSERTQRILDEAFAKFKSDHPEVAHAIESMNMSYAEYLRILSGLSSDIQTTAGSAQTPPC